MNVYEKPVLFSGPDLGLQDDSFGQRVAFWIKAVDQE
jgi:hypothetical protein